VQLPEALLVGTQAQVPALQIPLQQPNASEQEVPILPQHFPERQS
jgi:hypothetical protein